MPVPWFTGLQWPLLAFGAVTGAAEISRLVRGWIDAAVERSRRRGDLAPPAELPEQAVDGIGEIDLAAVIEVRRILAGDLEVAQEQRVQLVDRVGDVHRAAIV